jgi:hypothetical protein
LSRSVCSIDGVALQRFGVAVNDAATNRVLTYALAAAQATGRVFFVEYDLSGLSEDRIVSTLMQDWSRLVQQGVTNSSSYVHQNGAPVVGIFGFYLDRFSVSTANAILDIFQQPGPRHAFVAGAGQWFWRRDPKLTADWTALMYRMNSWQPWNAGNWDGRQSATTGYWHDDLLDFNGHGTCSCLGGG